MTELVITSSILIVVITALRHLLKGTISLRLQYALWLLVLVRLLVPVSPFESRMSVMGVFDTVATAHESQPVVTPPSSAGAAGRFDVIQSPSEEVVQPTESGPISGLQHSLFPWASLAKWIWFGGMGIVGLCFLSSNLILSRRLARTRIKRPVENCKLPVYETQELPTPCLFGIIRPAIYITPQVLADETWLNHILAHELTHFHHGDHIWSALRCLCLAIHWYNPLVWVAAVLSRRDGELACDESTILRIGEESRAQYGRTLIGLTCEKQSAMDLLCCATTMADGKRGIKERIALIAKKPKTAVGALIAVALVSVIAVGCTFTGAGKNNQTYTDEWFIEEAWQSAEDFAKANNMDILKSGATVTRHTDDISADVVFHESGGKRSVSASFALGDDGKWSLLPVNAITLLDPERWDRELDITVEVQSHLPRAVIDYATEYVAGQVDYYNEVGENPVPGGLGTYAVVEAKITGLTKINTGTAGLTDGVDMYLLEYRLRPDHPDRVVPVGGMKMEEIDGENWVTEWGSTGQPYLLLAWHDGGDEVSWQRVCVTNTDRITQEYGTPQMLERYGNEFTAAAMELYRQSDAYRPSLISTIADVTNVYRLELEMGHKEVREIAETMTIQLLNDLKDEEAGRTFTILDWKDLIVRADRMYDAWVVTGDVNVRYEGVLSPVGESSLVTGGEYVNISLGERHLKHIQGVFILSIPSGEAPSAVLEPPVLTRDMDVGIGVFADYADDERVVFHGYFGLFIYDLKAEKIIFSADLLKAVGTTVIQGSEGAAVRASADGDTIQLYYYPERGEPVMTYTIDTRTGEYSYGLYEPLDRYDTSSHNYYDRFSWGKLDELTYTDGQKSWLIFDGWDWAD